MARPGLGGEGVREPMRCGPARVGGRRGRKREGEEQSPGPAKAILKVFAWPGRFLNPSTKYNYGHWGFLLNEGSSIRRIRPG